MIWRDVFAAWREFDTRHPGPWRTGVVGLLGGSVAALLIALEKVAASPRTLHALAAVLAVLAIVVGRRLFWNDGERRLRMLLRLAGFLALATLLGRLAKLAGLSVTRAQMFAEGTSAMLRGTLVGLTVLTLAALLAVRFLDRRPVRELGIVPGPGFWGDLAFGLGLGAFLMTTVFGIEWLAGWVAIVDVAWTKPPDTSFARAFVNMTGVFLAVGFYEELASRGYMLRTFAQGLVCRWIPSTWAIVLGVALSSAVFGYGHFDNPNATWVSTVNIVLAGVVLALPFILTGRLAGSIGLHITWNLFQGCVYGLPVSGLVAPVSLLHVEQRGPSAWTGGAFGPEAGLLGVLAMLLGAACIVARERWRRGHARLHTGLVDGGRLFPA